MTKGHTRKFYYGAVNVHNVSGIEPVTGICADNCEQTFWSNTKNIFCILKITSGPVKQESFHRVQKQFPKFLF